jgi:hypothetical protein
MKSVFCVHIGCLLAAAAAVTMCTFVFFMLALPALGGGGGGLHPRGDSPCFQFTVLSQALLITAIVFFTQSHCVGVHLQGCKYNSSLTNFL